MVQERTINQELYDDLLTEARYLGDKPGVSGELDTIQGRWNQLMTLTEKKTIRMRKTLEAWTSYKEDADKLESLVQEIGGQLEDQPNVHAVELNELEAELAKYKVITKVLREWHIIFLHMK